MDLIVLHNSERRRGYIVGVPRSKWSTPEAYRKFTDMVTSRRYGNWESSDHNLQCSQIIDNSIHLFTFTIPEIQILVYASEIGPLRGRWTKSRGSDWSSAWISSQKMECGGPRQSQSP